MCGIAGEVSFGRAPHPETVARMTAAIAHRGPDAEGFFTEGACSLGHRRLSIVDLGGGAQPMTRAGVTLVFNGEAYDFVALREQLAARGHTCTTRSDTEVVLLAYLEWGEDFVDHVQGMFALALWDAPDQKLVLARDRLGKKPLHYALAQGAHFQAEAAGADRLIFGSELKALRAHGEVPLALDPVALVQYLAAEYVPAPRSIHAVIRKLPAAHLAVLDARGFRLRRYWELPAPGREAIDPVEAARELIRLLDAAVAKRLVADVPVGVFLSGGVDSTAIAALGVKHHPRLETFSIGFEEASFDESAFAQLAASRLGTLHRSERLSGSACVDLLPDAVASLDEPFADPSVLPTLLLSRFVRKHVTVALAGDGGDELFGGYDPFLAHRPAQLLARLPRQALAALRGAVARLPVASTNMSLDFRLKQLLRGLDVAPALRHQSWIGALGPSELRQILRPELAVHAEPQVLYAAVEEEAARGRALGVDDTSVDAALRFYTGRYLVDDILVKADRASMAASLEVRAPFLDTAVVEFAARLPASHKLSLTQTKRVLKRALAELVPREILARPKKGFGIPVARWIRGPLRPLFEELFAEKALAAGGIFVPAPTRALLTRHLAGEADLRKPLWTIAMLLLWQKQWGEG
jgi:asparagine synthase (glutamine-hydrolysing)